MLGEWALVITLIIKDPDYPRSQVVTLPWFKSEHACLEAKSSSELNLSLKAIRKGNVSVECVDKRTLQDLPEDAPDHREY